MRPVDDGGTQRETCRETVLDLIFSGQIPNERLIEMLLDRIERNEPAGERAEVRR